ncbi:MAG: hypothetical protein AAFN80_15730 [Pseudomonadota bacterium]
MSKWLAIAENGENGFNSLTDTRQEPAESPFLTVSAGCREEKSEKTLENTEPEWPPKAHGVEGMRHGFTVGGRPLTYTGRVVSLEDWRNLSEWEKHGPVGRGWNGKTQAWEMSE